MHLPTLIWLQLLLLTPELALLTVGQCPPPTRRRSPYLDNDDSVTGYSRLGNFLPKFRPNTSTENVDHLDSSSYSSLTSSKKRRKQHGKRDTNNDGSTFLWTLLDTYEGKTFFDRWTFYTGPDPTNGKVNYVDADFAFKNGLANVTEDGKVTMSGDNTNWYPSGGYRNSVRISSWAQYNGGLFILDVSRAPWGCGVWPAFWTLGNGNWPSNGEVDIIEGVHDNEHNQVAFHTMPGCKMTPKPDADFSGTVVQHDGKDNLECNGCINSNSGCAVGEWSRASYGPFFDSQGGGVFAMKWDENGINVYSFYRAAVPQDIFEGDPSPDGWGTPVASLSSKNCDLGKYFANHSVVFDITFCGDWAGNSYATSGCPGTCEERIMDPSNFVNATWNINSLKVYKKQPIRTPSAASRTRELTVSLSLLIVLLTTFLALL